MRWMIFVHRWLGVGLCLMFALWFASGAVMMYVPFPALSESDRLAASPPLGLAPSDTTVVTAIDRAGGSADRVRVIGSLSHGTLIVVETPAGETSVYRARSQQRVPLLDAAEARRAAENFSGTSANKIIGPFDFDQWVVHQAFDRYRPYFRVDMDDEQRSSVYVSQVTGEVVQRTTRRQRGWNYIGAVVHWIYPTIIRKHWVLWDRLVWWLSLLGIVGTLFGIVLGIVRYADARRRGRRGLASPFTGWMRWHHKLGLISAAFVLTWISSGWLSMDHGRLFSMPDPTPHQVARFRGIDIREAALQLAPSALQAFGGTTELEITALGGLPAVVQRRPGGSTVAIIDAATGPRAINESDVARAVRAAWPDTEIAASEIVMDDDMYAHLREGSLGRAVRRVVLVDPAETWVHVDLQNASIVSVMDRSRRVYRWLFNGLHSLDFPGLVDRRPLWDTLMLTLSACGLVFSVTGVVIAYRRIKR